MLGTRQRRDQGPGIVGYTRQSRNAQQAAVYLLSSEFNQQGLKIVMACDGELLEVQTGLIGDFNNENLMACAGVLKHMGFSARQIEQGMQDEALRLLAPGFNFSGLHDWPRG